MSDFAPLLERFFTDRLMLQRQASPHTISSYRDTFKLLLEFACERSGHPPSKLGIIDLDAATIADFLHSLETVRGNSTVTRNVRLAAIHSFFTYAAMQAPESAAVIQRVLAIPSKRVDRAIVSFLTSDESSALISAPNRKTWLGRRDHVLMLVAVHTGLRVSEITRLTAQDVHLGPGPYVRCMGKGRKERCTPLTRVAVQALHSWLAELSPHDDDPVFPTRQGKSLSRDAVAHLVARHVATATVVCPSMGTKNVTPHTLRHSTAMAMLRSGVDVSVISLWLGHESTASTTMYLHADMSLKEHALALTAPTSGDGAMKRYRAPDTLIAFLDDL